MGTVLFAWEMGGGLGHIGPMKVLAEALTALGHRAVFIVKDITSSRTILGRQWPILQTPIGAADQPVRWGAAGTYADIMALRGFARADALEPVVLSWIDAFEHIKPDLIVVDHSPTALLSAYGTIPAVIVGHGFYVPPSHYPALPAFRDSVPPVATERAIFDVIKTVQSRVGRPCPPSLPKLFTGHYVHCYSIRELDPYSEYRVREGSGPIETIPAMGPMDQSPNSIFAYLAGEDPRIQNIATALVDSKVPVQAYVRNASGVLVRYMARIGIVVHENPPPLARAFSEAAIIVSHGGGGVTHAALLAGKPQLLAPRYVEAELTSRRLQRLGVGLQIEGGTDPSTIRPLLEELLINTAYRQKAIQSAGEIRSRFPRAPLKELTDACQRALLDSNASTVTEIRA